MYWYNSTSTLAFQIMRLTAYLAEGEKHWKKAFKDVTEVCCAFKVDQKFLKHKKDYQINYLKSLE